MIVIAWTCVILGAVAVILAMSGAATVFAVGASALAGLALAALGIDLARRPRVQGPTRTDERER